MTTLRLAEESDIPAIIDMGRGMLSGGSFAPMTYAPEKVAAFIKANIRDGLVCITEVGGTAVGCMSGGIIEPWYSTDRMGIEHFVYVRPEHRGGRSAVKLISAWTRWCISENVKQIRPATAAHSEEADRLYLALGFKPVGTLFVMDQENFK